MAKQGEIIKNYDKSPEMGEVDYVVEWQKPTEKNGYTWYRLYASGWIIQGGKTGEVPSSNNSYTINLIHPMVDTNYCMFFTKHNSSTGAGSQAYIQDVCLYTQTTTSFTICRSYNGPIRWCVMGYVA